MFFIFLLVFIWTFVGGMVFDCITKYNNPLYLLGLLVPLIVTVVYLIVNGKDSDNNGIHITMKKDDEDDNN